MQGANLFRKRSLEPQVEVWSCRPKRLCLEAELQGSDCPMETSLGVAAANQQQVGSVQPRPPLLCCPRCLGGEPGHINHIMGH